MSDFGGQLAGLGLLIDALATADTIVEIADVFWREGLTAVGAVATGLALPDTAGRRLRFVPGVGRLHSPAVRWASVGVSDDLPVSEASRERSVLYFDDPDALLSRYPVLGQAQATTGDQSWALLPLTGVSPAGGVLTLAWDRPRTFSRDEKDLHIAVSRLCATAVSRARASDLQRRALGQLGLGVRPVSLPMMAGLDVAAAYSTADGTSVGGDFYDVFQIGDGNRWRLVVGDVSGSGIDAAGVAGMARHSCRAMGGSSSPVRTLTRLNDLLLTAPESERYLTALCADVSPSGDGVDVRLARAGHPRPLILRRDGTVEPVGGKGRPLGWFVEVDIAEHLARLAAGEMLLCYTDGVTEMRGAHGLLGEDGLMDALASCAGDTAHGTLDSLGAAVERYRTGRPTDDAAMVLLRVNDRYSD